MLVAKTKVPTTRWATDVSGPRISACNVTKIVQEMTFWKQVDFLQGRCSPPCGPVSSAMLCGDMNAVQDSDEIRMLVGKTKVLTPLISPDVFLQSFCRSQLPHTFVNLSFTKE